MIEINVFDNNSSVASQKQKLCEEICLRSEISVHFFVNDTNIGGDRNIQKCCVAAPEATFTWVLGDDDHIAIGSIPKIVASLLDNRDSLGLLIVADGSYVCDPIFRDTLFGSYEQFARLAIKHQPHLLIAHTLISCNIFRTDIFDLDEARYVLEKLTPRAGLSANFVHMRGLVKGLFCSDQNRKVLMPGSVSLDVSKRLPGEIDLSKEIISIYYFYFLWLLVELGVRIEQVPNKKGMWWLFRPTEPRGWRRWLRSPIVPR